MTLNSPMSGFSAAAMADRVVRYADLQPCYNAFVDTRTPGSEQKENFCIIGPGVSENPNQHVHIAEPHGFNVGGARQPPHCVNSQHSHETAEVFVAHSGEWRFDFGETAEDAQVFLHPGDVISLPVRTFRGFTNVGAEPGFLWSVLGGDDPGRVTWAPRVFDLAAEHGLVLLESGRLVDTVAGETVPDDAPVMRPPTRGDVAALRRVSPAEGEGFVVRADTVTAPGPHAIIGPQGPLTGGVGFTMTQLNLEPGQTIDAGASDGSEVLFVHSGSIDIVWGDQRLTLGAGDTISPPAGVPHAYEGRLASTAFLVVGGDELPALASA